MITTEELVAFPDDGIDRWLIRGELYSRPWEHRTPDTSRTLTSVGCALYNWAKAHALRHGVVLVDAYHRLACEPDTTLGIDVSFISNEQWASARGKPYVEGCPVLAAKVISPSDTHGDVIDAVREYLDAGVAIVWLFDPDFQTVGIFEASKEPRFFNRGDQLVAEPHLPGFSVRVAELFE